MEISENLYSCLLGIYCVLGTLLGAGDIAVKKEEKAPVFMEFTGGERNSK